MKQLFTVLLILLCINIQAQTSSIFFQNNTALELEVMAVQSGTHTMSTGEWTLKDTFVESWEHQLELLETNRDGGVHNGETFYFDIYVWSGIDTVQLQLKLEGNFFGSSMEYSLKGTGFDHPWYDGSGFHEESITFGGLPITIKYAPDGTDAFFARNITFAIQEENKPLYTIDSMDYNNPNIINVLSYNAQFLPFGVSGMGNATERADFIPTNISPYQDVVIFQEAFDDGPRNNNLTPAMTTAGFPYRTNILNDGQFPTWNGGVIIYSRWPIEFEDEYDYRNCDNNAADCLAAKGVLYARINKMGKKYHIFGTHVEAGGNANDIAIKKEQFGEQRDFIASQNIPADEAVILGGDMNTDASSVQYPDLVDSLNPIIGLHKGFHASTAVDRDSGNIIDHVWGIRNHLVPLDVYTTVWIYRSIADEIWGIFDPSDHLPVNGRFVYPDVDTPIVSMNEICGAGPFQLSVPAYSGLSYQWYLNGSAILGATSSTYTNPSPIATDTGSYSCIISTMFTVMDTGALAHPNWPDTAVQSFDFQVATVSYNDINMNPIISQQSDTLFSSVPYGNQWYDANGAISGATDSFYVLSQAGAYYAVVTQGNCSSNSSNIVNYTSVLELVNQERFKLFPNPAQDKITIESKAQAYHIEIIDAVGRTVLVEESKSEFLELDITNLPSACYWVKMKTEDGIWVERLIIK